MRVALDTNILVYAEGVGDEVRVNAAIALLERLPAEGVLVPAQALGELHRVLTGKAGIAKDEARRRAIAWADGFEVADSGWSAFQSAFDLCADHGMQVWDALILSVAAESGCRYMLSEDFQNGFTWRGVTVVDPFASTLPSVLRAWLGLPS